MEEWEGVEDGERMEDREGMGEGCTLSQGFWRKCFEELFSTECTMIAPSLPPEHIK